MTDPAPPSPDESLMAIGMFSRASLLSIKALRSYHEQGLLVPAAVDPATGYRSYHPSQLPDALVLARLRSLDLPLAAASEIMRARDPDITAKVLAEHRAAMEDRLAATERIVAELHAADATPSAHTPIHVRVEPHHHAVAVTGQVAVADFPHFLGPAYRRLAAALAAGLDRIGPDSALYVSELADDGPQRITAYAPIRTPGATIDGCGVIEIPTRHVAVVTHHGPFDTIGPTYAALGAWVARNARSAGDAVRERYLSGPGDVADPEQYRTEIQWPILAGKVTTP